MDQRDSRDTLNIQMHSRATRKSFFFVFKKETTRNREFESLHRIKKKIEFNWVNKNVNDFQISNYKTGWEEINDGSEKGREWQVQQQLFN